MLPFLPATGLNIVIGTYNTQKIAGERNLADQRSMRMNPKFEKVQFLQTYYLLWHSAFVTNKATLHKLQAVNSCVRQLNFN